ncbi:hypothetical protein, partial [Companilactobacillus nantensis]|uniref:hypothetical protein n=1 Tax=Companilactobacillus nantensis TaxID=305793 RepID=UPI001C9A1CCA
KAKAPPRFIFSEVLLFICIKLYTQYLPQHLFLVYIGSGSKTSSDRATPSAFHIFANHPQKAQIIHKDTKMLGS